MYFGGRPSRASGLRPLAARCFSSRSAPTASAATISVLTISPPKGHAYPAFRVGPRVVLRPRRVADRQLPPRPDVSVRDHIDDVWIAIIVMILVRIVNRAEEVLQPERRAREIVILEHRHGDEHVDVLGHDARKTRTDPAAGLDIVEIPAAVMLGIGSPANPSGRRLVQLVTRLGQFHVEPVPNHDVFGRHVRAPQPGHNRVDHRRLGRQPQRVHLDAHAGSRRDHAPPRRPRIRFAGQLLH